jgi:membrane associated rhomboid family serine protease
MARGGPVSNFGFPPFTRAVKALIIANVAVYLVIMLSRLAGAPGLALFADSYLYLRPVAVVHGQIWQLVTYAFFHDPSSVTHILFNMLGLWMFGAQFEMDFGTRRLYEFYFWCVVGAALTTLGVGALGIVAFQYAPIPLFAIMGHIWQQATIGASGGIYGLLIAFGILNGDRQIYVFPFPIAIKARYIVAIWLFIAFVSAFGGANGIAEFAHLGGALFGWLYLRFIPRYGLQVAASERAFGIRNRYYKWKRRQAAKKFEVYMRKNKSDEFFDEHGNYRRPSPDKKDDDSGWVN